MPKILPMQIISSLLCVPLDKYHFVIPQNKSRKDTSSIQTFATLEDGRDLAKTLINLYVHSSIKDKSKKTSDFNSSLKSVVFLNISLRVAVRYEQGNRVVTLCKALLPCYLGCGATNYDRQTLYFLANLKGNWSEYEVQVVLLNMFINNWKGKPKQSIYLLSINLYFKTNIKGAGTFSLVKLGISQMISLLMEFYRNLAVVFVEFMFCFCLFCLDDCFKSNQIKFIQLTRAAGITPLTLARKPSL
eukprot:Lithocolla_globosa_v1_NODE_7023_length_1004_cov_4.305585.p1 type:complete len:245 gc:universal NODE_7023_length_1004_cov_4.305585:766-32(-)